MEAEALPSGLGGELKSPLLCDSVPEIHHGSSGTKLIQPFPEHSFCLKQNTPVTVCGKKRFKMPCARFADSCHLVSCTIRQDYMPYDFTLIRFKGCLFLFLRISIYGIALAKRPGG